MNIREISIIAAIALSPVIAMAESSLKPISNKEAAALLSMPPSTSAGKIDLCEETARNFQGKTERTAEQILCNFDRYGASLFNVYQKALLQNKKLEGSVVFSLIIEPSGLVTLAEPIEGTLSNDAMINDLGSKIMTFKFPDQKVEQWSGKHTLNFFSGY